MNGDATSIVTAHVTHFCQLDSEGNDPVTLYLECLVCCFPGVSGPEYDQDQSTTTLRGRSLVLKFQDHSMTTWY